MNKKGFTLVELLAVIVILAIIALIATPMILGVIDTAKQGSAKSSALGYIEAVEKSIMIQQVNDSSATAPAGKYKIAEGGKKLIQVNGGKTITVDFKGAAPTKTSDGAVDYYVELNTDGSVKKAMLQFSSVHTSYVKYENNVASIVTSLES